MDLEKLKVNYARVIIRAGLNLYKGQNVLINTGPGTYGFARILAREAYKAGAGFVRIMVNDNWLVRYRIQEGGERDLEWLPDYVQGESREYLEADWARVRLDNTEEMDVLKDVDTDSLARVMAASRRALKTQQESLMRDEHPWCVVAVPGPGWCRHIMEQSGRGQEIQGLDDKALEGHLWELLKPILRLDRPDPALAWQEHMARLERRSHTLNQAGYRFLHFRGEGTDLTVGLLADSVWRGGSGTLPDGRRFMANLPTEEVYTTPDWRLTQGKVRVTRPVNVMESRVEGLELEFHSGRVVDFSARKGQEIMEKFLTLDEGASSVGEVALVAGESPIYRSGLLFGSILYDENASCHLALGAGYPSCLRDPSAYQNPQALRDHGCNASLLHTDFMIGGPGIDVAGIREDGREEALIVAGEFTQHLI